MYPYTNHHPRLSTRETKDPALAELAEDSRLLSLLQVAVADTEQIAELDVFGGEKAFASTAGGFVFDYRRNARNTARRTDTFYLGNH